MRSFIIGCFLFASFITNAFAQRLDFSDSNKHGLTSYSFNDTAGFLRATYTLPSSVSTGKITLHLRIKSNVVATYFVDVDDSRIATADIKFSRSAVYTYVITSAQRILDSGEIDIDVDMESLSNDYDNTQLDSTNYVDYYTDPASTMYYLYSKVSFANDVDATGNTINTLNEIAIDKTTGTDAYVVVTNNGKPIGTTNLIIDVYTKSGRHEEFVETIHQAVDSKSLSTTYRYHFTTKGHYVFKVYSQNETWINTGDVTIRYK